MTRARFNSSAAVAVLLGVLGWGRGLAQSTAQDSPFLPPAGTTIAASNVREPLELAGISIVGKKTYLSIFDLEKQRSRWIAVGETVAGIEVISCDEKNDRALIRTGGKTKVLTLRKSASAPVVAAGRDMTIPTDPTFAAVVAAATGTPAPVIGYAGPLPNTPAAVPPPSTAPLTEQAYQEREARMLVSDLLEIGVEQRKAYEAKKAAAEEAEKKGLPAPIDPVAK